MNLFKSFCVVIFMMITPVSFVYSQSEPITSDSLETIKVKVKGVGCSADVKSIAAEVEEVEGVNSCKVVKKGAKTIYEIRFNPNLTGEEKIHKAIEGTPGCKDPDSRPYKVKN